MKAFQMDLMPVQQVADAFTLLVRGTILKNIYNNDFPHNYLKTTLRPRARAAEG